MIIIPSLCSLGLQSSERNDPLLAGFPLNRGVRFTFTFIYGDFREDTKNEGPIRENTLLFKAKPALRFNNVLVLKEMTSRYLEVIIFLSVRLGRLSGDVVYFHQ